MAHINYVRQLEIRRSDRLEQIIPLDMGGCNFAAFGGTQQQRNATALQAASRFCGRCGIVVLINAPGGTTSPLAQGMQRLPGTLPDSHSQYRRTPVSNLSWASYDLLYGLDESTIVNLILPGQNTFGQIGQLNPMPGALMIYLRIMAHFFHQNPTKFGAYPYNMNALLQLTQMPYLQLEDEIIRHLPEPLRTQAQTYLSKPDIQISVATAVQQFAWPFQKYGWLPGTFDHHSRSSIIQAVTNRQILCIPVPDSAGELLNYIEAELAQLSAGNIQYLVISDGLDLSKSPALQSRFLAPNAGRYYTGILAESAYGVADTDADQGRLFSNCHQILVYRCASTDVAEVFSRNIGTYQHSEFHHHVGHHKAPFHLFAAKEHGVGEVLTTERNMRPDELMEHSNGVLLCGKLYPLPVFIRNLTTERRN